VHPERGVRAIMAQKHMPASRRSGNSIIEVTFMMPWLLFLFVGVFDFGFYAYALIATQNAARAVAVHNSISKTAATDPDGSGCQIAVFELQNAAYGRSMTGCAAPPLQVTSTLQHDSNNNDMANVVVTYQSAVLIPIPGLLTGQLAITRTAQMMVNPSADF
jgi:Flp pilus assembly protein TadG